MTNTACEDSKQKNGESKIATTTIHSTLIWKAYLTHIWTTSFDKYCKTITFQCLALGYCNILSYFLTWKQAISSKSQLYAGFFFKSPNIYIQVYIFPKQHHQNNAVVVKSYNSARLMLQHFLRHGKISIIP